MERRRTRFRRGQWSGGLAALALLMGALFLPTAAYARVVVNEMLDVQGIAATRCAPGIEDVELVDVQGKQHILVTETEDASGAVHLGFLQGFPSIQGIGQTTGDSYVFTQVSTDHVFISDEGDIRVLTAVQPARVVRKGSGDDFWSLITTHLTFNANGELTAFHTEFTLECQG